MVDTYEPVYLNIEGVPEKMKKVIQHVNGHFSGTPGKILYGPMGCGLP